MARTIAIKHSANVIVVLAVGGLALAGLILSEKPAPMEWNRVSRTASRRPTGQPQLVLAEPLLLAEGMACQWVPASTTSNVAETLQQQGLSERSRGTPVGDGARGIEVDRAPARVIRDTYPTYSAIAVDTNSNEVYLQDENLFGYKVFSRLDNTPANAEFTEPKRVVAGLKTKLEFNCALYVDPKTGDVYSVNNDTMDTMVVFPREARGDVAPKRQLHTPHGTYGIAVDEQAQELFLTVQHTNSVVVYPKSAQEEDKPLRTLSGDQTGLEDPHGIAVDQKNGWMFVSNHGTVKDSKPPWAGRFEAPSITAHSLKASGNTPPLRIIEGPKTQLNWPSHVYADPERGELFVANDVGHSILVFRISDNGDVAPIRVIRGPRTGIQNPTGVFVDTKNDELWVSNMGNHRAAVFARAADGNAAPLRTIRSAPDGKIALAIGNPGATAYDSNRQEILVPN